jgi:transposase
MTVYDRITQRKYKEIDHMMGYQDPPQENMFLYNIYLENRVRKDHPLRRISEVIDFDFIYKEVEDKYGKNGNVSVPPPVILKLIFLFFFYNVRSERELMETLPERIDWLWFLGYNLDSGIPDHSVISKARARWGEEIFKQFFERIVVQCVEKGLVDGTKIFMDASLIDANASNGVFMDKYSLKKYLNDGYLELEKRLEEKEGEVNTRYISTTDPDASIVRYKGGKARLQYKTHRAVDALHEIITAVEVTPGAVDEAHKMTSLIDSHTTNTLIKPDKVVADSKYGTIENLLECYDREIKAHMPVIQTRIKSTGLRKNIFSEEQFIYDKNTDTLVCPAGKILKKRSFHTHRDSISYSASGKDCKVCSLRPQCTRDSYSRSVQRHIRKEVLDKTISITKSSKAKRDLKIRQYLMERSYARSVRYGFDRARWRGLWKIGIQEYLVCAIQNIEALIRHMKKPLKGVMAKPLKGKAKQKITVGCQHIFSSIRACLYLFINMCSLHIFKAKIDLEGIHTL